MERRRGLAGNWLIPGATREWECRSSFIQDFVEENNVESVNDCPCIGTRRQA